jgi:hypothetical protein
MAKRSDVNLKKICRMVCVTPSVAWVAHCLPWLLRSGPVPSQVSFCLCESFVLLCLDLISNLFYSEIGTTHFLNMLVRLNDTCIMVHMWYV